MESQRLLISRFSYCPIKPEKWVQNKSSRQAQRLEKATSKTGDNFRLRFGQNIPLKTGNPMGYRKAVNPAPLSPHVEMTKDER